MDLKLQSNKRMKAQRWTPRFTMFRDSPHLPNPLPVNLRALDLIAKNLKETFAELQVATGRLWEITTEIDSARPAEIKRLNRERDAKLASVKNFMRTLRGLNETLKIMNRRQQEN